MWAMVPSAREEPTAAVLTVELESGDWTIRCNVLERLAHCAAARGDLPAILLMQASEAH